MALSDFEAALQNFSNAVSGAVNRKVSNAYLADNANAVGGQSSTQLVTTANAYTDAHANNTNNPHGTTAAQLGGYSTGEVDAKVAALVPTGIIPISAFGDAAGTPISTSIDTTNKLVVFAAGIKCLIAGQAFVLGSYSLAYAVNATTYFYLVLNTGVISLVASSTVRAETNTTMYVGKIVADASGNVSSNTIGRVTRVDIYRVSAVSAGSAIPVSTGTPDQAGTLAWQ